MEDGRIPKDILYGELASGRRSKGRPQLCYKDVCKRDMKALDINTEPWEDLAVDCMMWRGTLNQYLKEGEKKMVNAEIGKRACRKEHNSSNRPETTHKCDFCGRDYFSHIGLYSHKRRCNNQTGQPGCTLMIKLDGCLFVGCLSSQQHASVFQGRICSDCFACCHTEIEVADPTLHLTQSKYTDTGPTSPSTNPITPGAWQGSHWSANF